MTRETAEKIDEIAFCYGFNKTSRKPKFNVFVIYKSGQAYVFQHSKDILKSGIPLASLKQLITAMLDLLNLQLGIYAQRFSKEGKR